MNLKRSAQSIDSECSRKVLKQRPNEYFKSTLENCGLIIKPPPEKCVTSYETIIITRNIKKILHQDIDYPRNVSKFYSNFEEECKDLLVFKHYLYPNVIRKTGDNEIPEKDSVIKILLNIPILQKKIIDYVFDKSIDLTTESKCGPLIRMILKCFSGLDNIVDGEKIATNLINLLDVTSEKMVRLEIITAIPDIIGDQEHESIAAEMSRIMSEDHDLIPAILDCLTYLCLSEAQYERLQKRTLNILTGLSKCNHFPNFVKFLLMPGKMSENSYLEAVQGLRNALGWPSSLLTPQDIATSQMLTAAALRNSMISSKVVAKSWIKTISSCKISSDHKAIDFIVILILYSTSEEKQKITENILKKQIKLNILKKDLVDNAFEKFQPILKENLNHLINLTNSLLKINSDLILQTFASHIYMLMFSKLTDCCNKVIAELLQLGLDNKNCLIDIVSILNKVAVTEINLLKPYSIQMLRLLDKLDDMSLLEIKAVMNLVCGLAYSFENSVIRDDVHMIIRKELGSSNPIIKIQGIIAGIHAIKYLMVSNCNNEKIGPLPDDITFASDKYFPEGDLKEAARIIKLINCSTRQFPYMITFFYDELCHIIQCANYINKHFLDWITEAVTNDLQQNFIVDNLEPDKSGTIKLTMQYCLNSDSEMDEVIAINIGGLTLQAKNDVNVFILPPLFQVVQTLHSKQPDGLLGIDALLGCAVVMPVFDIDTIEDLTNSSVINILDCLVHCSNWFRELINAFASQSDPALRSKIFLRIMHIYKLESLIEQILLNCNFKYNPPSYIMNIRGIIGEQKEKTVKFLTQNSKTKHLKKNNQDESYLLETSRTQTKQHNIPSTKSKISLISNINYRPLTSNLLNILNAELVENNEKDTELTVEILVFVLKYLNINLHDVLLSKIKKNNFISKEDSNKTYDNEKAEACAKNVNSILPKIMEHLKFVSTYLDKHLNEDIQNETGVIYTPNIFQYVLCLEYIYNFCNMYFSWIGFKNHNIALLKSSLRIIANQDNENSVSLKDLTIDVTKYLQKHEKYCLQVSTAVSLTEFMKTIKEFNECNNNTNILRDITHKFLSRSWKTPDGVLEKGQIFNQGIDILAKINFINNEIVALKNIFLLLINEIDTLKKSNSKLNTFKCINKANFPIIYRNLGTAVQGVTKKRLDEGLTNAGHLELWKNISIILNCMSEISKTIENRNILSSFLKKSLPLIKLFTTQGIPIMQLEFKNKTQQILEILKILQKSTRFIQSLCCHSRLEKDTTLMSKVPYMKQLLESLIYKVKSVLISNKCSEAFWMGNLKNKNIRGEIIATQESNESEESVEDCDDQLPDDSDTDNEMLNPDSRSLSDIV